MSLRPCLDKGAMRRIGVHPALAQTVMGVSPLRNDVRVSAELVGLEPNLDVGSNELAFLLPCSIRGDRANCARHAVAQRIIGGSICRGRRGARVEAGGRRPRLEIFVLG